MKTTLSPLLRSNPLRSEEHTSELQSRLHLVCRLLLEKKKTSFAVSLAFYTAHPPYTDSCHSPVHEDHIDQHHSRHSRMVSRHPVPTARDTRCVLSRRD